MKGLVVALLVAVGVPAGGPIATGPAPQAGARSVTFRTTDGIAIAGTLFLPVRPVAPAVILVHMQTRSRQDWQVVGARLADAGLAALAIDLRGHGASGASPDASRGSADALKHAVLDIEAARGFLRTRPDIAADRVGIAGASMGANLAVLAAAGDPGIRSLALLSPGLDYRGLRTEPALKKYGGRPALIVASLEDPYAVRSARQLAADGPGTRELKLVSDAGHGTVMLARRPDLIGTLVDWFRRTLV